MLNDLLAYKISACIFLLFALVFCLSRQVTVAQNLRKRLGFKRCNTLQRQGLLTWILVAQLNCCNCNPCGTLWSPWLQLNVRVPLRIDATCCGVYKCDLDWLNCRKGVWQPKVIQSQSRSVIPVSLGSARGQLGLLMGVAMGFLPW